MINNAVLVSGVLQSDSVIHIHTCTLFQILFPYRSLQRGEQSSLCCTVGPCWLSILYIDVCVSVNEPVRFKSISARATLYPQGDLD